MAEKKIVSASTGKTLKGAAIKSGQSTVGLRVGAVVLWVAAIVFEVLALMVITEKLILPIFSNLEPLYGGIIFLVLDLICVIIGAQLWKKANHINPMSESNKALFWLWNNMGVIVCAIAFIPFVILLLKDEKADAKTKKFGTIAAVAALLIAGVASYDFNPVSAEQMEAAGLNNVYWTAHGKKFHTHNDCSSLSRSTELVAGSIDEATAAGKESLCSFCEKRDKKLLEAANVQQLPAPKEDKPAQKPAA